MDPLAQRLFDINARAAAADQRRSLEPLCSAQGPRVTLDDGSLLNFCSNDYLSLSSDPLLIEAVTRDVQHYGVGSGASSLLSGRSALHETLERRIAEKMQRESALLFSSGYLANLGLITALVQRHDSVFQDRLNHASLIDAVQLSRATSRRYPHGDMHRLETMLTNSPSTSSRWLITDAVFSMDGDVAPLGQLATIAKRFTATLIVDDAHGFGVLGNGAGTAVELELDETEVPIQVVTFGKALGSAGAAVVGSAMLIDALIQASRTFIYDTAPPPILAGACLAALDAIEQQPQRLQGLHDNIEYFRSSAKDFDLLPSNTPIQALVLGEATRALAYAEHLRGAGIYVRAVRPPTVPAGTSRLRLCINAGHTREDIDRLCDALLNCKRTMAA